MEIKEQLKQLYQESFGDEKEYVNYVFDNLYSEKSVKFFQKEGEILSAIYFLPRQLNFKNSLISSLFISGVSTKESARGNGYMKKLMRDIICEFSTKTIGAIFLSPKDEAYYISQGFSTILRAKKTKIEPKQPFFELKEVKNSEEFHFLQIENNAKKQVFFMRSNPFSKKIFGASLICDDKVYKVYDKGRYVGYFIKDKSGIFEYSIPCGELARVSQNPLEWFLWGEGDSYMMARIINPFMFFRDLPCVQSFCVEFKIKDDFIQKEYFVKFISQDGKLNCLPGEKANLTLSIEEITKWAFGLYHFDVLPDLWFDDSERSFGFFDRYF